MIHGDDVAFKVVREFVVREFNGDKFEQNYKGALSGDERKLTVEAAGGKGPQEMTFKPAQ